MDKRTFIKTSLMAGAGTLMTGPLLGSSKGTSESYSSLQEFEQPELGYAYDALEPYIDAQTMELHYSRHHAGYTRKFNAALKEAGISGRPLQDLFGNISKYSEAIRNNGGGYFNHNLYWKVMSPNGGGQPGGKLKQRIEKYFGSFDDFKKKFSSAAGTVFGSGWAWLILKNDQLKIIQTPNQDNPLMDVAHEKGFPLMCIDVWEHAYYLNYQNRRGEYIDAFWNVIDWNYVNQRLEMA